MEVGIKGPHAFTWHEDLIHLLPTPDGLDCITKAVSLRKKKKKKKTRT